MKLFISASVLSVMVFYSSLHSLNLNFSATIHKNYMFLLCNGLLVFIVRNSGLISSPDHRREPLKNAETEGRGAGAPAAATMEDSKKAESKVEVENERENGSVVEEESESLNSEVTEEEQSLISVQEEEEDDDDDHYGETEVLSTEELNRKCDEFIRKMKAGIKFESQQVLIF